MKSPINRLQALLFMLFLFTCVTAQESSSRKWKVAIFSEAFSLPTYKVIKSPIHPGIAVGMNLRTKTVRKHSKVFDANFAYYYHPLMGNSFLLWPEYRYERLFFNRLSLEGSVGVGYKHNISDRTVYKSNGDGSFEKVTDWGSPQAFVTIGLGIGYSINPDLKAVCSYKPFVDIPFAKLVPFGIHTMFNVGIQFNLKTKKD